MTINVRPSSHNMVLCFRGEKLQMSLYQIPALDWNVRMPFGLYMLHCVRGARSAVVGVGTVISYPCERPAEPWTLKAGGFLGNEVTLDNCSSKGFKNVDSWLRFNHLLSILSMGSDSQLSKNGGHDP